jgi:L-histidine N-alpha-methyltransferase
MTEGGISLDLAEEQGVGARSEARPDALADFAAAVLAGFARRPRSLPCRFFYDAAGCALFEEITALPEYYPTRVETELLLAYGGEIAALAGSDRVLVEFGSGSSRKTSLLIEALARVRAYVPIDIAGESLAEAADWLKEQHTDLVISPLIADFTRAVALPQIAWRGAKLGFFSGSTIGNLTHQEATAFLANAARLLGKDALFLLGVDLEKSPAILLPAYDDAQGVTARFNLNLLARINRELGGTFDLARFAHEAVWNEEAGRIEMYLTSLAVQRACVCGRDFHFAKGERIHTENSHKYAVDAFRALATRAGWEPMKAWTDQDRLFSLHLLRRG